MLSVFYRTIEVDKENNLLKKRGSIDSNGQIRVLKDFFPYTSDETFIFYTEGNSIDKKQVLCIMY